MQDSGHVLEGMRGAVHGHTDRAPSDQWVHHGAAEVRTCRGLMGYTVSCESGPSWHAGVGAAVMGEMVTWLWLWTRQERIEEEMAVDEGRS